MRSLALCLWIVALAPSIASASSSWSRVFWPPSWKSVDDRERIDDVINDVVVVGVGEGGRAIVLATPARAEQAPLSLLESATKAKGWRFRALPVRPDSDKILSASLSRSGTKLIVRGTSKVISVDLTTRALDIPSGGVSTHALGDELIPIEEPDGIVPFDEEGRSSEGQTQPMSSAECANAPVRAVFLEATGERDIVDRVYRRDMKSSDQRVDVCTSSNSSTLEPIASALMRIKKGRASEYSDDEIIKLGMQLPAAADRWIESHPLFADHVHNLEHWAVFKLEPNPAIYAPTLEFSSIEQVFPTGFDVWRGIVDDIEGHVDFTRELSNKKRGEALFLSYRRLLDEYSYDCDAGVVNRTRCWEVHDAVLSFPGSWLIEYWFYYPFDRGQGEHLHDSEHLFVEVDKLGGTVRQEIGAAHGVVSSNNVYRTATPTAPAVVLPLFALVEANKHATAPDIDGDGRFNLGIDANVFHDRAKVWGIRDEGGVTDAHLRSFEGSMARHTDRIVAGDAMPYFPKLEWLSGESYDLVSIDWKQRPPCKTKWTKSCAIDDITFDKDARHAFKALKKSFAPGVLFPRFGWGLAPRYEGDKRAQRIEVGGAIELASIIPIELLKFPGRVGVQTLWGGGAHDSKVRPFFGGTTFSYERLTTNMYGYSISYAVIRASGASSSYRTYLEFGPLLEFAPYPHVNLGTQLNLAYTNGFGLAPHIRAFISWVPRRGDFGIRASDKSPFF